MIEVRENIEDELTEKVLKKDNRRFKSEPRTNVISKEEFQERVQKVFNELHNTLSKSFGPYGSSTIIINYPHRHITKDGFIIMKSLSFDAKETLIDQAIADMAADICGRLNNTVGDGTTSSIIATNSIYQNYMKHKDELISLGLMPREVIKRFNSLRGLIDERLSHKTKSIMSDDPNILYSNIHDVVYVSSNGDEEITNYISDLYKELLSPSIVCVKSPDGVTRKLLVNGYRFEAVINDSLYVNNDDDCAHLNNSDVIILGTKVTAKTYKNILKPLSEESKERGRHLIVLAPFYDEIAVRQTIKLDLIKEKTDKGDINMVLCTYRNGTTRAKKLAEDFAMLMNTSIISRDMEENIHEKLSKGKAIWEVFNIDHRNISGTTAIAVDKDHAVKFTVGQDEEAITEKGMMILPTGENALRLGFSSVSTIGLNENNTIFSGKMYYNETIYNATVKAAKSDLEEKIKKYAALGTFNLEVSEAQARYYALGLKMGVIEVGGDSELSQGLLKDKVDDAVKAAYSAFTYGTVLGCNVNLIQAIDEVRTSLEGRSKADELLLKILSNGFRDVYKAVLKNAYIGTEKDQDDIYNEIINTSIITNKVRDLSLEVYSDHIVNSYATDSEILKATMDLIALLIVGNQTICTGKKAYE